MKIFKYTLKIKDIETIAMPKGAIILSCQEQHESILQRILKLQQKIQPPPPSLMETHNKEDVSKRIELLNQITQEGQKNGLYEETGKEAKVFDEAKLPKPSSKAEEPERGVQSTPTPKTTFRFFKEPSFSRQDMEGFAEWLELNAISFENLWSVRSSYPEKVPDRLLTTSEILDLYLKSKQ